MDLQNLESYCGLALEHFLVVLLCSCLAFGNGNVYSVPLHLEATLTFLWRLANESRLQPPKSSFLAFRLTLKL